VTPAIAVLVTSEVSSFFALPFARHSLHRKPLQVSDSTHTLEVCRTVHNLRPFVGLGFAKMRAVAFGRSSFDTYVPWLWETPSTLYETIDHSQFRRSVLASHFRSMRDPSRG
jgi:hypothetical protein